MAEIPGLSAGASPPAGQIRGESVRISVPGVDDRTARAPRDVVGSRASAASKATQPPHVIRFEGRELDPYAPRGTYLDITV